jgi:hypothetical protein
MMWIGALGVKPLATGSEGEKTQMAAATKIAQETITNSRLVLLERKVLKLFSFSPPYSILMLWFSFKDVLNTYASQHMVLKRRLVTLV